MNYANDHIRNVMLAGHSGSGKTTLAEAMLYLTKGTDRFGRVEDGDIVCGRQKTAYFAFDGSGTCGV